MPRCAMACLLFQTLWALHVLTTPCSQTPALCMSRAAGRDSGYEPPAPVKWGFREQGMDRQTITSMLLHLHCVQHQWIGRRLFFAITGSNLTALAHLPFPWSSGNRTTSKLKPLYRVLAPSQTCWYFHLITCSECVVCVGWGWVHTQGWCVHIYLMHSLMFLIYTVGLSLLWS